MLRRICAPLIVLAVTATMPLAGRQADAVDAAMNARIRDEGMDHSQVLDTVHYLTDRFGPRLSGSPNYEAAARWAVTRLESWGLTNGRLEPFDFGREGWLNVRASGYLVEPVHDNLVFEVLGWTPSTAGTVRAQAVYVMPPAGPEVPGRGGATVRLGPTEEELEAYLTEIRPRVRNAIVLVGPHIAVPLDETPAELRRDDEEVARMFNPDPDATGRRGGRGGRGGRAGGNGDGPARLSPLEVSRRLTSFLMDQNVRLRLIDAGEANGQIRAFSVVGYNPEETLPTAVLRNEDYGRIFRLLVDGTTVTLEFTIENETYPGGRTSYNAVAEIRGTDLADQIVMLGGHLDSWHSATGATDNAIGCAVMMEAVRILQAVGATPRRTIRVGLWGGEEQGLIGSQAYVADTFGTFEEPKPAWATFSGYLNLDSGTGRIRGAQVFGPPDAAAVVREYLAPFADLGVAGAVARSSRNPGNSDHTSFNAAGLPGIELVQDPIEYESHTWHTNLDTYERIVEDDVKQAAVVVASLVYHLAMRDQPLPRFDPAAMPPPPGR